MNAISRGDASYLSGVGMIAAALAVLFMPLEVNAVESNINVQCPTSTVEHPDLDTDPTTREAGIVCKHLAAGDGMVTMADNYRDASGALTGAGKPLYIFSFADVKLPEKAILDGDIATEAEYPGWVMEQGLLAANGPAPTIKVYEDDELFLSLTNVGMAMRPDLSDPHTVHWHGFPNASSVFDGVPDASISINMGATLTYYYQAKDAGTYMYHCHVEAAEHMQMGMLGSLYVMPRQDKLAAGTDLSDAFASNDANVANGGTTPAPAIDNGAVHVADAKYAFNDGDGTTRYDIDYPIQLGSFDPDFHDASFGVQPLPFRDMRDRYFLLNGRGYPDTVNPGALSTVDPLGKTQVSQPVSSLIRANPGERILLRISNLNVTQFNTIGVSGLPMEVVGLDARLLRDGTGKNMYYKTNSLTLGGGQSADVIIDTSGPDGMPGTADDITGTFFLYTKNLDQLANDAENFGGMMTEIRIN